MDILIKGEDDIVSIHSFKPKVKVHVWDDESCVTAKQVCCKQVVHILFDSCIMFCMLLGSYFKYDDKRDARLVTAFCP